MSLRLDFCSTEAARYACENWHYSKTMPSGKTVKIGVWEDEKFIGCVIFGSSVCPHLGKQFNLTQYQVCELVRVALSSHKEPVSRILAIALKVLKKCCPGILLVFSYADKDQGHSGAIYQAGNWLYIGKVQGGQNFYINGKKTHNRSIKHTYGTTSLEFLRRKNINVEIKPTLGKYKYVMPLAQDLRAKIKKIALQYPKRAPIVQE